MRKLGAIVFVLFLLAAAGVAQIPTSGNVYFGWSLNHGEVVPFSDTRTLHGWEASVEGHMFPYVGLVADVSQQFGTVFLGGPFGFHSEERTEQYLFGPRASFRVGPVRPYAHFLIGVGHVHEINHNVGFEDSDTSYAHAIGGGVDYSLAGPLNWRFQVDSLTTNFYDDWQHNTRFSTGLAVHF